MVSLRKMYDRFNIFAGEQCIGCIFRKNRTWTYHLEPGRPPTITLEYLDCITQMMNNQEINSDD